MKTRNAASGALLAALCGLSQIMGICASAQALAQAVTPVSEVVLANRDSIFPASDPNTVYGKQFFLTAGSSQNIWVGVGFDLTPFANGVISNSSITFESPDPLVLTNGTLQVGHFGDWNETATTFNLLTTSPFVVDTTLLTTSGTLANGDYYLTFYGPTLDALENQWAKGTNPGLFYNSSSLVAYSSEGATPGSRESLKFETNNFTFTPNAVPEPSTWAAFGFGLALLGAAQLRSRRAL